VVDGAESELGILDLIQVSRHLNPGFQTVPVLVSSQKVFVESLDRAFENVCELDLIFHFDEVCTSPYTMISRVWRSLS
jgi:AP-3 complex subunit sigma